MNAEIIVKEALSLYGIVAPFTVHAYGQGLINHTWLVEKNDRQYILQKINQHIFHNPPDIAYNIQLAGHFLRKHYPDYLFIQPVNTLSGDVMASTPDGWYRLFPFVEGSHTIDVAITCQQACEAAKQFGRFTAKLSDFLAQRLKITLPDFHNLQLRYNQFLEAVKTAVPERLQQAQSCIGHLVAQQNIVAVYKKICNDTRFVLRATHHDTKISNVLLDEQGRGICVIDLDTLMPGYFISDFGDMMRTYLCPVSEEEKDLSLIEVRDDFYTAIRDGYLSEMGDVLTHEEKKHLYYSGLFMTYMQALRFLTDYLNNDVYYGSDYEGHNLVRAQNQYRLLECLLEKQEKLGRTT